MAGSGEFPKTGANTDVIYGNDYNTIQSVIAGVVSTFYGNTVSSSQLAGNPLIGAAAWDLLRVDINKAYKHITGADSSITDVNQGDLITAAHANSYKTAADYCETNKTTVNAGQLASVTRTNSITLPWNGTRVWAETYTWASSDDANYFFNTGGYFVVNIDGDGSLGTSKDDDWQNNILNVIGTQTYNRTNWVNATNIDVTEYGNVSQYAENYARIQITKVGTTQVSITLTVSDSDTGDQTGTGPAVDEDVNTNAYASIARYYSIDAIVAPAPVVATTSQWTDNFEATVLVVGGGGGGGAAPDDSVGGGGSGGGGGGFNAFSITLTPSTTYTITVGSGGAGGEYPAPQGLTGDPSSLVNNSTAATYTAGGGGGGGGGQGPFQGGAGGSPNGNAGGTARNPGGSNGIGAGGGGGGADDAPVSGSGGAYPEFKGGDGPQWYVNGLRYSGGGGGTTDFNNYGNGGEGGGGRGGADDQSGFAGTANTGGGGGGAGQSANGGNGGSGVVIISYSDGLNAAASTTGSPTYTVSGGRRTYTFTQSGTITFGTLT